MNNFHNVNTTAKYCISANSSMHIADFLFMRKNTVLLSKSHELYHQLKLLTYLSQIRK